MAERIVVVGGARSGKSGVAEALVAPAGGVTYVATGGGDDEEMAARVAAHRARRPSSWTTVETTDVAGAIRAAAPGGVLVDALGPWLADRMGAHDLWPDAGAATAAPDADRAEGLLAELDHAWAAAAAHDGGPVVVVCEDVGAGVVAADAATRRFVDLAGEATQRLAAGADRALWVVAGRALELPAPAGVATPADTRGERRPAEDAGELDGLRAHGDAMVPDGALDLAVNVVAGGPPAHVAATLRAAAADVGAYPDDTAARQRVAARHGLDPASVLPTAGATDGLWTLAAGLDAGHAAVIHPQFTEAEVALRVHGWRITHVRRRAERDWALEPDAVPADADLVVVGNPTNPLGCVDAAESVAALAQPGRLVVVDEAFMDFVADDDAASLAGRVAGGGVVVVRTPTKLWGLPGVRAGALLAAPALAARLARRRRPWAVGSVALAALAACADDDGYRGRVAAETAAERDALRGRLAALDGVEVIAEPAANFVCVRVPDGPQISERLLAQAVAVRPSTFPGLSADHLRVTVRDAGASDRFVTALAGALGQPVPPDRSEAR